MTRRLPNIYEVKAASDETGGVLTAMEMTIPAGLGPPYTPPGSRAPTPPEPANPPLGIPGAGLGAPSHTLSFP